MTPTLAGIVLALVAALPPGLASDRTAPAQNPVVRVIGETRVIGQSDPQLWPGVLALLPSSPESIIILDLGTLSARSRARVRGLEAFVLSGHPAVFVVRQGTTLRQAELGGALERLILASVIWHEMGHLEGLDEPAALEREERLWRELVAAGRVDGALGLSIAAELAAKRSARAPSETARKSLAP